MKKRIIIPLILLWYVKFANFRCREHILFYSIHILENTAEDGFSAPMFAWRMTCKVRNCWLSGLLQDTPIHWRCWGAEGLVPISTQKVLILMYDMLFWGNKIYLVQVGCWWGARGYLKEFRHQRGICGHIGRKYVEVWCLVVKNASLRDLWYIFRTFSRYPMISVRHMQIFFWRDTLRSAERYPEDIWRISARRCRASPNAWSSTGGFVPQIQIHSYPGSILVYFSDAPSIHPLNFN